MTVTIVLLVVAVLFALFLIRFSPWRTAAPKSDDLHGALEPVYVPALMNLIDSENLEFLQRSLNPTDFRKALRERNRALRVYVRRISHNTRVLIAAAENAQRASDPAVAESGRVLLATSIETRTRALRALTALYIGELFPSVLPDLSEAVHTYESAAARMHSLRSLTAAR